VSAGTKIQWCDATVNFWWGCAKYSTGCKHCYAESIARRLRASEVTWGPHGARWLRVGEACLELLKLNQRAEKKKTRLRVFINSMSDTFEHRRDLDGARKIIFLIAPCVPWLDLLLLTKRIESVEELVPGAWADNVWLGFSAEDQATFDARWPIAEYVGRRFNITRIFCSGEPMLGPLDISAAEWIASSNDEPASHRLDWMILGGESGQRARPLDVDHLRATLQQARRFGIAPFVKQLGRRPVFFNSSNKPATVDRLELKDSHGGDMAEWPEDLRVREVPS
jgi:protein gp37